MKSVNEIMLKLSTDMVDNPKELSDYLVLLTANLWKYGRATVDAEIAYSKKWEEVRLASDTDGQANMRIKTHKEYEDWQMAKVNEKVVLELIRSIKKRLTSLTDELKSY